MQSSGVWEAPVWDPPVVHTSKHSPQFLVHHEFSGFMSSIIAALPAAVYLVLVQKLDGFGSDPQPQEPLESPVYLVVEAQGFPLYIGGQPWHFEFTGDAKLSQGAVGV